MAARPVVAIFFFKCVAAQYLAAFFSPVRADLYVNNDIREILISILNDRIGGQS